MTPVTSQIFRPARFSGKARFPSITLDQYHRMIETGILTENAPIELLDGCLVLKDRSKAGEDPMSTGADHRWSVQQLGRVLGGVAAYGCELQAQQPVAIPPDGEPEPDGAIIRVAQDDYRGRKPSAADTLCVIEVADSSLEHDRTTKLRIYARAGIPQYVIIDLVNRLVEDYRQPEPEGERYAHARGASGRGRPSSSPAATGGSCPCRSTNCCRDGRPARFFAPTVLQIRGTGPTIAAMSIPDSPAAVALPYLTPEFPGVGGSIKNRPEDFFVQEVPLYEPGGEGEHVYCEIQKVGVTTFEAVDRVARALNVPREEIGYAGLKDAQAVTRQVLSIWGTTPEAVMAMKAPDLTVLWARGTGTSCGWGTWPATASP